jgi:hypothetical protein
MGYLFSGKGLDAGLRKNYLDYVYALSEEEGILAIRGKLSGC